ncbi:hypothetical protein [Bradyrhizobium sp.]|uniref:hypothetical protein n=1 Tax=Bradyrhizobium sp. TaxID=376 RepID=UPI003C75C628
MRCFILAAALVLACGTAHAQDLNKDLTNLQLAQATTPPPAAPAPQAAPTAQAAPDAAAPTTAQPSKPAEKKQPRRRETDEEKARRIAAKYGVSW